MSDSSRSTSNSSLFGWLSHVWSLHISVHLRPLARREQSGSLHVRTHLHACSCNTVSGAGERTLHPIYNQLTIVIHDQLGTAEQGMGHLEWPMTQVTHWALDPRPTWPMTHGSPGPSPHTRASLTQIYRLPGTVFGHCICTHTFKLLHNCTCKQTAHTDTCKFRVC